MSLLQLDPKKRLCGWKFRFMNLFIKNHCSSTCTSYQSIISIKSIHSIIETSLIQPTLSPSLRRSQGLNPIRLHNFWRFWLRRVKQLLLVSLLITNMWNSGNFWWRGSGCSPLAWLSHPCSSGMRNWRSSL